MKAAVPAESYVIHLSSASLVSCDVYMIIVTVNCLSQETEVTSTPTRPVDNVVIATKGLQDRNI